MRVDRAGSETAELHGVLGRPNIAAVLVTLACTLSCVKSTIPRHVEVVDSATRDSRVVSVDAPIAIGFFPLVEPVEWGNGIELAAEHFSFAIDDLSICLEASDVTVEVVEAKELLVDNLGERDVIDLSAISNESIGCYLAAPGRPPIIVRADNGASSLTVRCPSAAAVYFDVPACCPEGWTCCPDGTPILAGSECAQR